MKLKSIILSLLSITFCLSSCNIEGELLSINTYDNEGRVMVLRLSIPGGELFNRTSIGAPTTSTIVPGLNVVDIYLYNQKSGTLYYKYTLNSMELTLASTHEGLRITNIHNNIDAITVICNNTKEKKFSIELHEEITTLFAKEMNIALEQDLNNVTYIGSDIDLIKTNSHSEGDNNHDCLNTEINLVPLVARVEISGITATGMSSTKKGEYSSLLMRSLFIEAVYSKGVRLDYLDNPSASTPATLNATSIDTEGTVPKWWLEVLENSNLNTSLSSTPWSPSYENSTQTGVFAFHIFENGNVPTIGIHLHASINNKNNLARYVKFHDYVDATGTIDRFKAGYIYKITPTFNVDCVKTFEENAKEVILSIIVQQWSVRNNIIAGGGNLSWVDINLGSVEKPKWLKVADRNAELGTINGTTSGANTNDYGYYYQWSNSVNDSDNKEKAHQACYNFGEGGGAWRLPRLDELEVIMGKGSNLSDSSRKVKWDGSAWKLYDERNINQRNNFVYFQMCGIIVGNSGTGPYGTANVDGEGAYWSSTPAGDRKAWRASLRMTGESLVGTFATYFGLAIRCVKDAKQGIDKLMS